MRLRSTLATLLLTTLPYGAMAADSSEPRTFTEEEIQQIVIKTLMDKPEVIIEAVKQMQEKEQANAADRARQMVQAYRTSLFEDKDSPVTGPEDADITIVEFFDYNCGYCKRSLPNVLKMLETDKKVNFVFKEYPVLAPSSEDAARASLAMYYLQPDRYFDFHAALFRLGGKFDEATLADLAETMDADREDFIEMMASERVNKHLDDTRELAGKMGASGVPMFIIGNEMFPGAISYEAMKQQVDAVRAAMNEKS
jgi:protein-disulfide isomerase